ncbi:MAG: STAS domain-containing protein [Desulfovibrio desulfuricans]|jgi:anti-anti-sigma factor|uniref:STAS domain-containing protein n=1 Tax=uncultured Desulfovibrio sp. TaxID=167968 RepID=UPI001B20B792|nr:STAS domain-containing protein [uncultured Desulfovibrio sp.]MBE6442722.1 STAS domain-containing protein [Desulfovibrio desulfuricans]MBO5489975.1 STAS domain-containing protein [Desulfovibrio sp.]
MDITATQDNGCTVLALSGRMDATTTVEFDNAAQAALKEGHTHILVDLKDLVYMSSAGLRSLLNLAKTAKAAQGKLCFCCLQPMVAEVFRISGFDRMLSVHDDREAGLTALRA